MSSIGLDGPILEKEFVNNTKTFRYLPKMEFACVREKKRLAMY
jgi:hypothetical protein